MRIETFKMERMQSTYENQVECNLSESGVEPMRPEDLLEGDAERRAFLQQKLGYCQSNGSEELRYLAVSTMITPEVVEYPDSGKVALISRQPAPDGSLRVVRQIGRPGASLDYWDGE